MAERPQTDGQAMAAVQNAVMWAAMAVSFVAASVCALFFVRWLIPWAVFPADLLMWAEGWFVESILKFEIGAPLYGPAGDSNSMNYTPAAPVLTWWMLRLFGLPPEVPTLRLLQLVFTGAAIVVACWNVLATRRLLGLAELGRSFWYWAPLGAMLLALAGTSPRVNQYTWTLHVDALSLLVSMLCWSALLSALHAPARWKLVWLGVMPALGFAVKPTLLSWGPIYALALLIFRFGDWRRLLLELSTVTAVAVALYAGFNAWFFALWGDNYLFWVYEVMGGSRSQISWNDASNTALVRIIDHVGLVWWSLSLGLAGAWLSLRATPRPAVAALAGAWLLLVAFEAYATGHNWIVLYHFGPAVLIGCSWFLAWLPSHIALPFEKADGSRLSGWAGAGALVFSVLSVLLALEVAPSNDSRKFRLYQNQGTLAMLEQVAAINEEFEGEDPEKVLLDVGSWPYLAARSLARDRAVPLGDQPIVGRYENFEPLLERIRTRHYDKIIVRNFEDDFFLYDWFAWERPSGVRASLEENYQVVRVIPGPDIRHVMHDGPVSVLVPR